MVDRVGGVAALGEEGCDLVEVGGLGGAQDQTAGQRPAHRLSIAGLDAQRPLISTPPCRACGRGPACPEAIVVARKAGQGRGQAGGAFGDPVWLGADRLRLSPLWTDVCRNGHAAW